MTKLAVFVGALLFSQSVFAVLLTNRWVSTASGKWETAANWSTGDVALSNAVNMITNVTTKTVTVDASSPAGSSMVLTNLLIWGPVNTINTLLISSVGSTPLHILNSLVISNGGVVTVTNSILLVDGVLGGSNTINAALTVQAGGVVTSTAVTAIGTVAGTTGTVTVVGNGSYWRSAGFLLVGFSSTNNILNVGNGSSVFATNLSVGFLTSSTSNRVNVSGGSLYVTNAAGNGLLDVRRGTFTFNSGTINVDQLLLTNGTASSMIFTGGTLISSSTFVTNGVQFTVGNGTDPATFTLDGGVHAFANGLRIRNSAFLTGCGTINASVLVDAGGTVQADCGGTLTFSAAITNNGLLIVTNGTTVNFNGAVINTGTINALDGNVKFLSTLQNTGTILTNLLPNVWVSAASGKWETAGNWSVGAPSITQQGEMITNAASKTVTIDATTVASNAVNGCMTVSNLTISAASGASNTLSLAGSGLVTPLTIVNNLVLDTNGVATLNNAALSVLNSLYVGKSGSGNRLVISNGANVFDTTGYVGDNGVGSGGNNNTVAVSGSGSIWSNASLLSIGDASSANTLTITNGGAVYDGNSLVGSGGKSNTVTVSGNGALWQSAGTLQIGFNGSDSNTLIIGSGGTVIADNAAVGSGASALGNRVIITNGSLYVTNALGGGVLDFQHGTFSFNGGTLTVDQLLMTNGAGSSSMVFTGGTFTSGSVTMSNGQQFAVGNSSTAANFQLLGGIYTFQNGLRIRSNAFLTGCGTINGNVLVDVGGTVLADCGGTLSFTGAVTNNGNIFAINNTFINFYGPVVNNGQINATNGTVLIYSSFQNNGSVSGNVFIIATNSWKTASSGKWELGLNWSASVPTALQPALLISNATSKTVTVDATTVASNAINGCLSINNLTVGGPNNTTNKLLLTGAGTITPLSILQSLIIDTNGVVVIDSSELSAVNNADLFFNVLVGNRGGNATMVVTNGGTLFSTISEVGAGDTGAFNSKNNNVLITGTNSVWNNSEDLYVGYGSNSWNNSLIISNGATVFSGFSALGHDNNASNNSVLVTGTGSVWNVSGDLAVGSYLGSSNTLVISAGGAVFSDVGLVGGAGFGGPTSSNLVLVTGSGSVWSNQSGLQMGNEGSANSLVISNGGALFDDSAFVGNSFSTNNTVVVSGSGSLWENNSGLTVGLYGSSNLLAITGGSVVASYAFIGQSDADFLGLASNNVIRVDSGSLLVTSPDGSGTLVVSPFGGNGSLILNGGSVTVDTLVATNGLNSIVTLNGGTLTPSSAFVTNGQPFVIGASTSNSTYVAFSGNHSFGSNLVVRQGALVLNGGTVTANRLLLTNGAASSMVFTSGMLQTSGTAVTNTQTFAVGNGTNAAIYHLLGGVHSFANSLRIRNAAFLTGCGTITSPVLIDTGATVQADCGGTLTFTGVVTNNGAFSAVNGTTVNFLGAVVNNGTINGIDGLIHFLSTVQNNGTIITNIPPSTTDSWASASSGKWEGIANWSRGAAPSVADPADVFTNAGSKTVTIDATTVLTNAINGCMILSNLTVSAPGSASNTLFLSNAGTTTPLFFRQQLVIDTNGAVLVNHSALLATNNAFIDIVVGNLGANASLTITNGAAVYSGAAQVGVSTPSKNNTVWISGGTWQNGGNLLVGGLSGVTNTLNIGSGGSVVASNVYIGFGSLSVGNAINISANGNLYATNSLSTGALDVRRGTLTFNGGSVTVDSFVATNGANSVVNLSVGALNSKATVVTNTQEFLVGDGSDTALYHLLGGVHSFANDLHISANAILSGCGTINGSVLVDNGGTVQADCGGTLTFSGAVTNNGDLDAINGTTVNFLGAVVNNGTITATNGIVQFFSTLENNGTLNTNPPPASATNSWSSSTDGKWETDGNWSMGSAPSLIDPADLITNASSKTVTIDATTSGSFPGSLVVSNLTVAASLPDTNTLWLNNAGTTTPLSVLQQFMIDANGAVVVSNSAVLSSDMVVGATAGASQTLLTISGGSLAVTNAQGNGALDVRGGKVVLNSGTVSVDQLVLTNALNGVIQFGGGALNSANTFVNNSLVFVAGDGTGAATLALTSGGLGFHQFGNGLVVTNNASVVGNGTIIGPTTVLGTWSPGFSIGMITTSNDLVLSGATINYDLGITGGNPTGDLTAVNGNLTLGGTLNITDAGGFSNATYKLFTYTGALTYNSVTIGTTPNPGLTYLIDTNVPGQVNLDVAFTAPAGPITGTSPVSVGQTNVSYSISSVSGATTYTWTVPTGATIANGQGSTSITVNFGCSAVSGNVAVTPSNTNGNGAPSTFAVTVNSVGAAGGISGSTSVNAGDNGITYSISSVSGATTYAWTAPAGASVTTGQGTTSITVNYGCAAVSGNVTVTPANAYGCNGTPATLAVTVTGVDAAGSISGLSSLCAASNGVAYSISSVNGATSYTWTAPAGASIASGQGSTSIAINWGSTGGLVTVTPVNANSCSGTVATLSVTVNPLPTVFNITGGGSYCAAGSPVAVGLDGSQSGVNYQLLLNGNATGLPVPGTGVALSLGNQTQPGAYTVMAVNATTGCTTTMTGSATVTLMDPFICWQLQYFGCTNCPQAAATADPDGDGQNNLAEFLAGTIPTNSASVLRIKSLVRSGADFAITWSTAGGHTNILQAANGGANGSYSTNNFADIATSQTIVGGSGDAITNYLDVSGATNMPSRFYRIRLVP